MKLTIFGRVLQSFLLVTVAVAVVAEAQVRSPDPPSWQQVQSLAVSADTDGIRMLMAGAGGPEDVARRYFDVAHMLYRSGRDLQSFVRIARMGIEYDLAEADSAERGGDHPRADLFRLFAKQLAYDLASFTWTGWDEPGIRIGTADLEAGADAARLNLRLAEELERGPEPMANAYFILGAHALARSDYDEAGRYFETFGAIARSAELEAMAIAADGYGVITREAAGSGNPGTYVLEPVRQRLRDLPASDPEFWIDQLDTAWTVFVTG